MGHSPWGHKESDTSEVTEHARRQLRQKGLISEGRASSQQPHPALCTLGRLLSLLP